MDREREVAVRRALGRAGRELTITAALSLNRHSHEGSEKLNELLLHVKSSLEYLVVVERLALESGGEVRDAGDAQHLDSHMPGDDYLVDGRHTHEVGAQDTEGADLRRGFEAWAGDCDVHALRERESVLLGSRLCEVTQADRVGLGHVEKSFAKLGVVLADQRVGAGEVDVV